MATIPVRFEFLCNNEKLRFTHPVPRSLVDANPAAAQNDPQYKKLFIETITPIMHEHQSAAVAASRPQCDICGSPTTLAILTPMSWLHIVADPFVNVFANPACNKRECDIKTRQKVQNFIMNDMPQMAETSSGTASAPESFASAEKTMELRICRVCQKAENTKKCTRCGVAFYCSKEHQAADWPSHKKACKKVARERAANTE